ncbi:Endoplasmic reticulum mannosyl-oligosaccharide 1,2-alpha-mannosidase [Hypsibius exemplaris]|uniref:alpha-1,2-Mannosidase n=1 Tax=Hypsibius exemplaris TaxID=2072580 RepID=A0A1W0WQV1_HYPEX|nr:Endoplasmic reticulum mannosyl-oligosaccharide 1,2-alpha-mannosidase [Hypsibius exemplaris]
MTSYGPGGVNIPMGGGLGIGTTNLYDANSKQRRRLFPLWRTWNRFSKLQRYMLCCGLALLGLFVIARSSASTGAAVENVISARRKIVEEQAELRGDLVADLPPNGRRVKGEDPDIVLGEEEEDKDKNEVDRLLGAETGQDEEMSNDSVGGGAGGEIVQEKPLRRRPPLRTAAVTQSTTQQGSMEKMQEGMVMPMPKTFTGPDNDRQRQVVDGFQWAWDAYKRYAWGHDELKPLSRSYKEWFHIGLTLVDSLDTMYIMGLTKEFNEAQKWITETLTFEKDVDVNLFEITIRAVGGLLSVYHLSGDDVFKEKALDLGERLLNAFGTSTGVPYSDVNLKKRSAHAPKWGPDSSSAEVTTLQLEFRDLSYVSGDPKYEAKAFRVSEHFHKLEKKNGLIPIFINAITGEFRPSSTISFGARGDSYYEYLLKQWIQDGKRVDWLRSDFIEAMAGAKTHLIKYSHPNHLLFVGELLGGDHFSPKMDALACFLPGTLALGVMNGLPLEHLEIAEQLANTCHEMYVRQATKLGPEIAHFNVGSGMEVPLGTVDIHVKDNDAHALLRPEFVESLFYLYRLTKNQTYQDWGWDVFQALEKHAKVPNGGYASIEDVRTTGKVRQRDHMESFLLAETFKYLFLLMGTDQSLLPLDEWVFNSEAHPLPIRKAPLLVKPSSSSSA